MTDSEKVKAALTFIAAMRHGANVDHPVANHPANAGLKLQTNGICDILEAVLRDGDLKRAMAHVADMPTRWKLLSVAPSSSSEAAKPDEAKPSSPKLGVPEADTRAGED